MEEKIKEYYSKFIEQYSQKNYPEWFNFCKKYNEQFGNDGYKLGKSGHKLEHFAILQTPIYDERNIIIVGNNNSWFIDDKRRIAESLEIVRGLEKGIPKENYLNSKESGYSKSLKSYFEILGEDSKNLFERAIGINRLWIQTGPKCPPTDCELTKEIKSNAALSMEWKNLERTCRQWTKEIIELVNPKLVLLLSGAAQKLYPEGVHANGFWVQHSFAPSYKWPTTKIAGGPKTANNTERQKIEDIMHGLIKAGLI